MGATQRIGFRRSYLLIGVVALCAMGCSRDRTLSSFDAAPFDSAFDAGFRDAGFRDAGRDVFAPFDSGLRDAGTDIPAFDVGATDAGTDAGVRPDAGGTMDAGTDAGAGAVPVGSYRYRRLPVGGLEEVVAVAFHPDGSYAIALDRTNALHVFDWETEVATLVDLDPPGRSNLYFEDLVFDRAGDGAWLVGTEIDDGARSGVIFRFDDAAYRASGADAAVTELTETRAGERFSAITLPHGDGPSGMGWPVILSTTVSEPYIARVRELDPSTEMFEGLFVAQATAAGCDDLAFVNNDFGGWGIVIVCGSGFADTKYYTEIGGVPEWRPAPAGTLGNTSSVEAHPSGDYALAIGWSGRRVHRHQGGAWRPASSAPWFSSLGIWGIGMQEDGRRALIVGRAGGSALRGTVMEYRHNLWSMGAITDVSIPGFGSPPYSAGSNTYLRDAAFRPGCDGGLIAGGATSFSGSTGMLIEFEIEGARDCRP